METIITFLKQNYNLLCLALAFVGVLIAVIQFVAELKKKGKDK